MLYIANWKMYLSFTHQINFINEHKDFIISKNIIICPSFIALEKITSSNNNLQIGAQDCSAFEYGAYTGEISAISLKEIGCKFCIVGHNDLRKKDNSNEVIAKKIEVLFKNKIHPVICIGEDENDYKNKRTQETIAKQLESFLNIVKNQQFTVAYEPAWAIGTNKIPQPYEIQQILNFIKNMLEKHKFQKDNYKILYGGSVSSINASELKKIMYLDGFLIGKSSTNFQELKKIVELK